MLKWHMYSIFNSSRITSIIITNGLHACAPFRIQNGPKWTIVRQNCGISRYDLMEYTHTHTHTWAQKENNNRTKKQNRMEGKMWWLQLVKQFNDKTNAHFANFHFKISKQKIGKQIERKKNRNCELIVGIELHHICVLLEQQLREFVIIFPMKTSNITIKRQFFFVVCIVQIFIQILNVRRVF